MFRPGIGSCLWRHGLSVQSPTLWISFGPSHFLIVREGNFIPSRTEWHLHFELLEWLVNYGPFLGCYTAVAHPAVVSRADPALNGAPVASSIGDTCCLKQGPPFGSPCRICVICTSGRLAELANVRFVAMGDEYYSGGENPFYLVFMLINR